MDMIKLLLAEMLAVIKGLDVRPALNGAVPGEEGEKSSDDASYDLDEEEAKQD